MKGIVRILGESVLKTCKRLQQEEVSKTLTSFSNKIGGHKEGTQILDTEDCDHDESCTIYSEVQNQKLY